MKKRSLSAAKVSGVVAGNPKQSRCLLTQPSRRTDLLDLAEKRKFSQHIPKPIGSDFRRTKDLSESPISVYQLYKSGPPNETSTACFSPEQEEWFTEVYRDNWSWVLAKARRSGVADPESAAIEAMCKAMIAFRPKRGRFGPWLWWILHCRLADLHRRESLRRALWDRLPEHLDFVDHAAEALVARGHLRDWIDEALKHLPAEDQLLIRLKYEDKLSLKEISKVAKAAYPVLDRSRAETAIIPPPGKAPQNSHAP